MLPSATQRRAARRQAAGLNAHQSFGRHPASAARLLLMGMAPSLPPQRDDSGLQQTTDGPTAEEQDGMPRTPALRSPPASLQAW